MYSYGFRMGRMPLYMGFSKMMTAGVRRFVTSFVRYMLAGGLGFIIDYAVLIVCYEMLGSHYLVSSAAGFIAGLIFVYITSNKWVFPTRRMEQKRWLEFTIFAVIGVVGIGLTMLFMWFFVDVCHIHPLISKLFTTALVLFWNFLARKNVLYS